MMDIQFVVVLNMRPPISLALNSFFRAYRPQPEPLNQAILYSIFYLNPSKNRPAS